MPRTRPQTCTECGHVDQRNRVERGLFICRGCGVVAHADRSASRNIATRGESVWNAGRESRVPATPGVSGRRSQPTSELGATSKPGPSGPVKLTPSMSRRESRPMRAPCRRTVPGRRGA
ncbi:zinc ribbon domain-containing protein [Streptomyces sp. NPDC057257]|uniref:zinc ribbon domain-containing protein n=1 Tax=Streptomyces sp. NPDC057257 TaxID=3346071 RepID=UPI003644A957